MRCPRSARWASAQYQHGASRLSRAIGTREGDGGDVREALGAAGGAGPRPGRSGDAGARVRAAGACSGAARGGAAAARAAVAPVWNGERVGEGEGLAGKLTAGSVWAEGG